MLTDGDLTREEGCEFTQKMTNLIKETLSSTKSLETSASKLYYNYIRFAPLILLVMVSTTHRVDLLHCVLQSNPYCYLLSSHGETDL